MEPSVAGVERCKGRTISAPPEGKVTKALAAGLIEMTLPDKPRSSKQRYRITPPGLAALKRIEAEK